MNDQQKKTTYNYTNKTTTIPGCSRRQGVPNKLYGNWTIIVIGTVSHVTQNQEFSFHFRNTTKIILSSISVQIIFVLIQQFLTIVQAIAPVLVVKERKLWNEGFWHLQAVAVDSLLCWAQVRVRSVRRI